MGNYDDDFDAAFEQADSDFKAKYAAILSTMRGFSEDEIAQFTPSAGDRQVYDQLIAAVNEASQQNLAIADLRAKIESLGQTAVAIAGKIAGLKDII